MPREMEHEIKQTNTGKVLARVWLEKGKVKADPESYLARLKSMSAMGKTVADGEEFLEHLPSRYKSGYTTCRRVE